MRLRDPELDVLGDIVFEGVALGVSLCERLRELLPLVLIEVELVRVDDAVTVGDCEVEVVFVCRDVGVNVGDGDADREGEYDPWGEAEWLIVPRLCEYEGVADFEPLREAVTDDDGVGVKDRLMDAVITSVRVAVTLSLPECSVVTVTVSDMDTDIDVVIVREPVPVSETVDVRVSVAVEDNVTDRSSVDVSVNVVDFDCERSPVNVIVRENVTDSSSV